MSYFRRTLVFDEPYWMGQLWSALAELRGEFEASRRNAARRQAEAEADARQLCDANERVADYLGAILGGLAPDVVWMQGPGWTVQGRAKGEHVDATIKVGLRVDGDEQEPSVFTACHGDVCVHGTTMRETLAALRAALADHPSPAAHAVASSLERITPPRSPRKRSRARKPVDNVIQGEGSGGA